MTADQSRPVPRASGVQGRGRDAVLAAIRECAPAGMELRYDGTEDKYAAAYVAGVQAAHDAADRILALVRPVPPQGRKVGTEFTPGHSMNVVERTTPPQGIDRDADADAAWQAYKEREWHGWDSLQPDLHEAFLAGWVARPVRPVEGVTLAPEEALRVAGAVREYIDGFEVEAGEFDDLRALAARLEAAQ